MGQFVVAFRKDAKQEDARKVTPCALEKRASRLHREMRSLERKHPRSVDVPDVAAHSGTPVCCGS